MQAMRGATVALGAMNRSMNLPALQHIAMEFERENDVMEQRQEMMDDAIDDAMDTGLEEEGDEVVDQVLAEIGVDLNQSLVSFSYPPSQHPRIVDQSTDSGCLLRTIGHRDAVRLANYGGCRREGRTGSGRRERGWWRPGR